MRVEIMKPFKKPWANLAVFEQEPDARALTGLLQQQGFAARTFNDRLIQLLLFLCPPHATHRVQCRHDEVRSALEFMESDAAASLLLNRAIGCPCCGSLEIQYPQMNRGFIMPTIWLHLGIIFRIIEHEAYCEHCHHVWHLSDAKTSGHVEKAVGAHE